ncbi:MAG: 50S ribosomal protein L10 [bacterium]|nr:50S ribosomal protein L10 [bacterium]
MITKKQKEEIVSELSKKFAEEKIAIFSKIHGVSVAKISAFRRELKKIGAELKIAKKTLTQRAMDAANITAKVRELEGEVGVIFGYQENQAETAKLTQKFQKENETFKILLGLFGKQILSREQVLMLAKLPPREQLLAQLARILISPIRNLMNVLTGNQRNLVVLLNKIKDSK